MNKYYAISHSIPEYIKLQKKAIVKRFCEEKNAEAIERLKNPVFKVEPDPITNSILYVINPKFVVNISKQRDIRRQRTMSGEIQELVSRNIQISIDLSVPFHLMIDHLLNKKAKISSSGENITFIIQNVNSTYEFDKLGSVQIRINGLQLDNEDHWVADVL